MLPVYPLQGTSALNGVQMGQKGTYPVLSNTVPGNSPRRRQRHLQAAKHKQEQRRQMLPCRRSGCQCLLLAARPVQHDRHTTVSREGRENSVDKPVNSQALPGVLG